MHLVLLSVFLIAPVWAQRTSLDGAHNRPLRLLGLMLSGRSSDEKSSLRRAEAAEMTQLTNMQRARRPWRFCDSRNGPGRRSETPPSSVHRLRPGDIDIIGAMGDSLSAGAGLFATAALQVSVENRGAAFTAGGQGTWRQYLTIPNILKEFNPQLYGYAVRDGLSTDRSSRFNVAELGAMSRDMPYMATVLVRRLRRDPHVNMTHHWKLVTIFISNNDICGDICYYSDPQQTVGWHERNMLKTYRYLRDNVPRLMLNVVPPPNLRFFTRLRGAPDRCQFTLPFTCPCLGGKTPAELDRYEEINKQWIAKDYEIVARDEFNTDDFTINVQPFTKFLDLPRKSNGFSDMRYLSYDCFHLSQSGHATGANGLWNNMLQKHDEKTEWNPVIFEDFLCPTEQRPYLMTRNNSKSDFKL